MNSTMKSDIEIARNAYKKPITEIAKTIGIPDEHLHSYGHHIAKIDFKHLDNIQDNKDGNLILVTALTPTPAGEGKTTTTVAIGDALSLIGKKTMVCIREPSLGPCFGMKGGAAGGGYSQVVPMENINLHFTGDLHAISVANNLLSALIDNHIHWGNELGFDVRRITWKRVIDMNDRSLRNITVGKGGPGDGIPREDHFDITVASEVMAVFCLSENLKELEERLGNIIVGYTKEKKPIKASELNANKAMTVLLKDAMMPNLVQTLEHTPTLIHGGPFANIAHGCNSLIATRSALKMADFVVTEAGFGADLGAEKFFNIKCRKAGLHPSVAVIVVTIKALKRHGGVEPKDLSAPNIDAVRLGLKNLGRHLENLEIFGVPTVIALNHYSEDSEEECLEVVNYADAKDKKAFICKHWQDGGAGAKELAEYVAELAEADHTKFKPLYSDSLPLFLKIKNIAQNLYRASEVTANTKVRNQLKEWEDAGYGDLPICMAKTQYSFSTDPKLYGAPNNHVLNIREVRLSAGAGFIVALCGDMMTMPGLPKDPSANYIQLNDSMEIEGLF